MYDNEGETTIDGASNMGNGWNILDRNNANNSGTNGQSGLNSLDINSS